jgi:hypothetical protein
MAALVACGGREAPRADASASDNDATDDDAIDASASCNVIDAAMCTTASEFLACTNGGCLSDGAPCNGPTLPCVNACGVDEYAAGCGTIMVSAPPPSPACRVVFETPDALEFYCCPCAD